MQLLQKMLARFNGLHYPQEYLCLAKEAFFPPLHIYLVNNNRIIKDITNQHAFVGYSPLVFAVPSPVSDHLHRTLRLIFSLRVLQPNEFFSKKDALASLELSLIKEGSPQNIQPSRGHSMLFYEGVHGTHGFLSSFHQFVERINNGLNNKKPNNVFLPGNLYEQVKIAYAIPRVISLITVAKDDRFNLFPTDLHGQVDDGHYIISLRTGGKACQQVEAAGRVLISQVSADAYQTVYGLGKNHMQEPRSKESLPFGSELSASFQWPLPEKALSYKELVLMDSFTHGIHRIMLFRIGSSQQYGNQNNTLAHIHNSYATWRYKNGLPGNYLLR
jgi:hypothetical protein